MPKEIMADLAWFSALFIVFCSSNDILSYSSVTEEHFDTFCVDIRLLVYELAYTGEEEEERRKKINFFNSTSLKLI